MYETSASITGWRKSSRCESSMCVEVAPTPSGVAMRNNVTPDVLLKFPAGTWQSFLAGVRAGEFDV